MKRKTNQITKPTTTKRRLTLGDLVVVAFEQAELVTSDPSRAAHLAARSISKLLAAQPRLARTLVGP